MKPSLLHLPILKRVLKPLTKVGLKDSSDLLLRCVLGCIYPFIYIKYMLATLLAVFSCSPGTLRGFLLGL